MKRSMQTSKETRIPGFFSRTAGSVLLLSSLLLGTFVSPANAQTKPADAKKPAPAEVKKADDQPKYTRPTWWFGAAVGANVNFYRGTTQELTDALTVPAAFRKATGAGLFLAPLVEYHKPDSRLGFMLEVGYDNRSAAFNTVTTPCNCPADLEVGLSYITIEPSLRFAPFESNFYVYGGPRLAFGLGKSFEYQLGINPAIPSQAPTPAFEGDFSAMDKNLLSFQIGAGYDIMLTSQDKERQWALSPFVAFHPYFGQAPRTIETWSLSTLRAGATLKFGSGKEIERKAEPAPAAKPVPVAALEKDVVFTVNSPKNVPTERRIRETFPIRNYIFFDLGSNEIPNRYVLINKSQVKDFQEDRMETFTPKRLSGRSTREMLVYYNMINIVGDRMKRYPETTIKLLGASENGPKEGLVMAGNVKKYLVSVFGIDSTRISLEGRTKPKIPSEQPGATVDLVQLREGDRRVSIESSSPVMLMEYQTGPNTPLKPVEIAGTETAPIDSYVSFMVDSATVSLTSWILESRDKTGKITSFGPYTKNLIRLPGKTVLGTQPDGLYNFTMVGKTKSGKVIRKYADAKMTLWTVPVQEQGLRYSIIYEFNNSDAILSYEKYLSEVVTPKIPKNGTVVLHGYTDTIGDASYNQKLSLARANDVRGILEKSLAKAGRTDVTFEVYGFGEDEDLSPFGNEFPEERFYNRSVVIDLIPPIK